MLRFRVTSTTCSLVPNEIENKFETSYTDYEDSSQTLSDTTTAEPMETRRRRHKRSLSQSRRRPNRRRARNKAMRPFQKEMSVLSSSTCSDASSTLSLSIITVTLKLLPSRFLGISVVSDSEGMFGSGGGDLGRLTEGGVYVGSVVADGIVAADGRIEAGDMILQVNEQSLEDLTNEQAVQVIRHAVGTGKFIKLVVAKRWDAIPRAKSRHDPIGALSRAPVKPVDTMKWAAEQAAITESKHRDDQSIRSSVNDDSYDLSTVIHDEDDLDVTLTEDFGREDSNLGAFFTRPSHSDLNDASSCSVLNLSASSDMEAICRAMLAIDSGLDIRDRMWLKLRIPNGFLGSDLVDWLHRNVRWRFSNTEVLENLCKSGFADKRDARKYARALLRAGYIRNTVDRISFSEQCYYVFSQHLIPPPIGLPDLDSITSFSNSSVRSRLPCLPAAERSCSFIRNSTMRSYGSAFNPSIADSIASRSNLSDVFIDRSINYSRSSSSNSTITGSHDNHSLLEKDFNGFMKKQKRCNHREMRHLSQSMSKCTINSDRSNNILM